VSKTEAEIESLAKMAQQLSDMVDRGEMTLDGSLYQAEIHCGKEGCRCMRSAHRHRMWCLSYVRDGKSRTRTVPEAALAEVRRMCQAHRELRRARRDLLWLAREITRLLDRHGKAMAKRGWCRFEELKEAGR